MIVLIGFVAALDATWLYLALFRGMFWSPSVRLGPAGELASWPSVAVVVPARNEASVLTRTLPRLVHQDYAGSARVLLVDDGSDDDTAEVTAEVVAADPPLELAVVSGVEPPEGWMGKVWAMEQGRQVAGDADYVLLTDADIEHPPDSLRRMVAHAEGNGLDMVSLMAKLRVANRWERLVVPAFVYFFAELYPFRWVNRPGRSTAAAAGGCVLVRRAALERAGAFDSIRGAVIDDVSLGRALKGSGSRIWLGFSDGVASNRPYERLADLWNMVARSAFTQLRYSAALLAGTVIGLLFVFVLPVAALVIGIAYDQWLLTALAAAAWGLMALTYGPMLLYYGIWPGAAFLLPVTASLYTAMTVDSARRHWFGRGVAWKGRTYAPSAGTQPS